MELLTEGSDTMSHPPRIPVLLPDDQPVIYFMTLCVTSRRKVFANPPVWTAIRAAITRLERWHTCAAIAMPDHVHVLAAPHDRNASPGEYSKWFKRHVRQHLNARWQWQAGCFDRLLRSHESAQEKWVYIREHPVTAGLVSRWQDWPYQ